MRSTRIMLPVVLAMGLLFASAVWAVNTAPAPPRSVAVTDISTATVTALRLTFTKSLDDHAGANDVISYKVFKRLPGGSPTYLTPITATGATKYQLDITGLTSNQRYGIGVMAFDGSLTSTPVVIWIAPFYLPPPVNLVVKDHLADSGNALDVKFGKSTGDAVSGPVTGYTVYTRTATSAFAYLKTIPATHATTYSTVLTGLTKKVKLGVGIRATDGTHYSAWLVVWATPIDNIAPAPPRDAKLLNPVADNGTTMQFTFTNSLDDAVGKDVVSYRMYKKTASTSFALVGTVTATHATSYKYVFRGLTPGLRYCFAAAAFDGTNNSTMVQIWGDTLPPGPARSLTLTDVPNDLGTALKLTFAPSVDDHAGASDVTQYRILRRTAATSSTLIKTITANGSASYTYTLTGLTKNVKYGVTVLAWDGFQASTAAVIWATPLDNMPPAPPTGVTVTDWPSDDGTSLKVAFKHSADDAGTTPKASAYLVYRSTAQTTLGTKIATITATKATTYSYQSTGLTVGKTYWYSVRTSGPTGQSAPTVAVSGVPVDNRYVRPPLNLTAQDRPYDTGGVVNLTWSKSGDDAAGTKIVIKYYVYRKMANVQQDPTKIATIPATGTAKYAWSDATVPLELILYEYTVKAVASNGAKSAAAGPARAAAEDNNVVVFEPPTGLTVIDVSGDTGHQLLLSWHRSVSEGDIGPPPPPPSVSSEKDAYGGQYEFYRRTATGTYPSLPSFIVSAAGTADPMSQVDTGLTTGTRYYYKALYRRYNQISNFTAEVSAIPVNGTAAKVASSTADTSATPDQATSSGLSVSLLNAAVQIPAGQNALLGVSVSGAGRCAVCLEYAQGTSVARTAAVVGTGSYQTQLMLKTSNLPIGTVLQVRAVAGGDGAVAASAISTVTIVAP